MPPRGDAPGLKRGRHRLPYWIAKQVVRDPMGFPDKCIALPADADDEELGKLCREHTAELNKWIEQQSSGEEPRLTVTRYDGSVKSICRIYQEHPLSRFSKVKFSTRKTYIKDLKLIEETVGRRLIRNVTVLDVQNWYDEWRKPDPTIKDGGERIDRAHDGVAMFRTVIYFNAALRNADCKVLASELERVKFEKGGAREEELTYAQATAFIKKALEIGRKGIMPADRALHLAIGTAAQFELLLRQKDIIGEWANKGQTRKLPPGIPVLDRGHEAWAGFFTWESVPGWRWRMKTSKSKYRSAAVFDLSTFSLLLPLLEAVPLDQREGAIVKGDKGLPVRQAMYARWWRQIARAADIPDQVWNMDARAGGATEADESGAALADIQGALTHDEVKTTIRYIRRGRTKKIANVAEARKQKRAAEGEVNE